MQRLAGRRIFTVGKRTYRWEDVVLALHLWGEHGLLERQAREGLACEKRLEAKGEDISEDDLEAAADEWRYERDLLAADDMEEWLEHRGLDIQEWSGYIGRSVLRRQWASDLAAIVRKQPVSRAEAEAVMYAEGVCSGKVSELIDRLAGEAAVYERLASDKASRRRDIACTKAELRPVLSKLPATVRRKGLYGLSPAATLERAELIGCVGICLDRLVDRIAAPAAIAREIEANELEWTRFDCRTVSFSDEEMAREAVLLVREDGLPLERAAETARSSVTDVRYILEDVEPALRDRLIGALPGQLIGPIEADGAFLLVSVVDRVEPAPRERGIRARARDRLIRHTIQREIEGRVRWHERF